MAEFLQDIFCEKCGRQFVSCNKINFGDIEPELFTCKSCGKNHSFIFYPALNAKIKTAESGLKIENENEASCFFHNQKKADKICSVCGRFICSLCSIEINGKILCPLCFNENKTKCDSNLVDSFFLYDRLALDIALLGIITVYFGIFLAPASLFISIKHWKKMSLYPFPRSKIRFIAASVISVLVILAWISIIIFLIYFFTLKKTIK
ncbi:MAG TPA: hypothetical protein PKY81_05115 [bacterium]|nr:hypothetical protein [bacterium]HPN30317.1 hypothetical protein [bacterium]